MKHSSKTVQQRSQVYVVNENFPKKELFCNLNAPFKTYYLKLFPTNSFCMQMNYMGKGKSAIYTLALQFNLLYLLN